MDKQVLNLFEKLYRKNCCRVEVGAMKSLSIGFGEKIFHNNPKLKEKYYGEWEIGTYYCSWRILLNSGIICGSNDGNEKELNDKVKQINFGRMVKIDQPTTMDVSIHFDNDYRVDILPTISDDDEYFHIFCPDEIYIKLSKDGNWSISS